MSQPSAPPPRTTRPAVFAATIVPFAVAVAYASIAAPYWLEHEGVSLARIGVLGGTTMLPHALKVFWAPLIDLFGRRRTWFLAMTLLTVALLAALAFLPDLSHHLAAFALLCTASQVTSTTAAAAADGLMAATTRPEDQGRASGFRMAGNVGGTGIFGALAIKLGSLADRQVAVLAMAAVVLLSSLAALAVAEPARLQAAARAVAGAAGRGAGALGEMLHRLRVVGADLLHTLLSREGWTGLVICAVPVGAGALTNLFSGMGKPYGASENQVALVNGLLGGVVGAAGAVAGGWMADRMNRRLAYAVAGGLTACSALAMYLGPLAPATYVWGTLGYNLANGIAFATLAALILDMVGHSPAAATKYTAFIAVSNLAGSYVEAIDGLGSEVGGMGVRGAVLFDALLTVAGIAVLLAMVAVTRREARAQGLPTSGAPPLAG
jgi:MFS transporter, PAT family, beta-lactamase induction signal transducer AmpG